MNEEHLEIIEREIEYGKKANTAYDLYIKDFIDDARNRIFEAFEELNISDTDGLLQLKLMQSSIKALEDSVLSDIESKKLAEKQLQSEASKH